MKITNLLLFFFCGVLFSSHAQDGGIDLKSVGQDYIDRMVSEINDDHSTAIILNLAETDTSEWVATYSKEYDVLGRTLEEKFYGQWRGRPAQTGANVYNSVLRMPCYT